MPGGAGGALNIYNNWRLLPAVRCVAGFCLGFPTWRAPRSPAVASWARYPSIALSAGGLAMLFPASGAPDLAVYVLLPVLISSLFAGAGPLQRLLARHTPVLLVPAFLGVTALVAPLAHTLVERPFRPLVRRVMAWPWWVECALRTDHLGLAGE